MVIGDSPEGNDELDDSPQPTRTGIARVDFSQLANPVVLLAVGAVGLGLGVLLWPIPGDPWPARVLGAALIVLAAQALQRTLTQRAISWVAAGVDVGLLVVGILLVLTPERPGPVAGQALDLLAVLVSLAWIGLSAVVVAASLDTGTAGVTTYAGAARLLVRWLFSRPKSANARQDLYDKVLYEDPEAASPIGRFLTLMGLAAVIASMGVLADSTVAVIAGMLVAPLMMPMMGMAVSLAMGWPRRLARSAAIVAAGIAVSIFVALALALANPDAIDVAANSEISSRVTPTIRDLIIAVAAGGAGAYGLSRPDVSDSLPGAAVAISLVPPLTVAGVTAAQGDWASTAGALLLFTTNTLAILTVGGATFVLTGVAPIQRMTTRPRPWPTRLLVVGSAAVLVGVALLLNGASLGAAALEHDRAETTVDRWLSAVSHHPLDIAIDGDDVTVVVAGPSDDRPDATVLASDLSTEFGRTIAVDVRFVVEDQVTAAGE
ncbi:MAG: DUF389 domain-containing protein [Acidimicrobiales bacterium]